MCGRTACALAPHDVVRACSYRNRHGKCEQPAWVDAPSGQQYNPGHNIAPGAFTPVLLSANHLRNKSTQPISPCGSSDRVIMPMKWGLVPPWHQGDPYKIPYETNNCRAEGMLEKKTFKVPLTKGNRCVILADGFFEWKSSRDGKQPYYFYFPHDELKTSLLKKEVSEFQGVKTERTSNVRSVSEYENILCSDLSHERKKNKLHLQASSCKEEPVSCTDKPIRNTADAEDRKEVEEGAGGSLPIIKQEFCDGTVKHIEEEEEPGIAGACQVKQEFSGDSRREDVELHCSEEKRKSDTDEEDAPSWKGHKLLTMAGVFDVWRAAQNAPALYSYSVITVSSSSDMDWCHHRMPAILSTEEEVQNWLDFSSLPLSKVVSLIRPKECLVHHPVTKQMNNSRYQAEDSVKPVQIGRVVSPGNKLMQQWLATGSPGKRKLQDSDADSKSSQGSASRKNKKTEGETLMMKWLKSGSPVKKI